MTRYQPWAIVEQDEGLMVEVHSGGTLVFMVDYDECKENPEYVTERIEELIDSGNSFPKAHVDRIMDILRSYPHNEPFKEEA